MTTRESKPFALLVKHALRGASNMTFQKGIWEKTDDSFDAEGNARYKIIRHKGFVKIPKKESVNGKIVYEMKEVPTTYLIQWNMGQNLHDLDRILGLSDRLPRKPSSKIGLMNKGSFAELCYQAPEDFWLLSRNEHGKPNELKMEFGRYVRLIENCHEDYGNSELKPQNFIDYYRNGRLEETTKFLRELYSKVVDPEMKKELESTLVDAAHFYVSIRSFPEGHEFFGKLDDERFKLDYHLESSIYQHNLYHGRVMKKNNRSVYFEFSNGKVVKLNNKTAVDLMPENKYILAEIETRQVKKVDNSIYTILEVKISVNGTYVSTFWVTDQVVDKRVKSGSEVSTVEPKLWNKVEEWDVQKKMGKCSMRFTCLSKQEDEKQKALWNGSINIEEVRGVNVYWNGRLLGPAYWKDKAQRGEGWGDQRNSGPIRCDICIDENHELINMLNIQTDKSVINLRESHPCFRRLMDMIVGNLVNNYTKSTVKTEQQKANKDWKPEWIPAEVFYVILNGQKPPAPRPAPAPPTPAPGPAPGPSGGLTEPGRIVVPEITRLIPKSERDLVKYMSDFVKEYSEMNITSIERKSSVFAQDSLSKHMDSVYQIKKILEHIQNR